MKTKTYAEYKKEQRGRQQSNSNCGSSTPMNNSNNNKPVQIAKYVSSSKKQQLIPPGSLGTLTKATYDRLKQQSQQPQHSRRMGPTTSALVRPAPLFSRPPPGAALRVMPPKKRVKLDEDDEVATNTKKSSEPVNKQTNSIKTKTVYNIQNPYLKGKEKLEERNRNIYLKGKEKIEERSKSPYLKGKDKLEERSQQKPPKKQMRVPSTQSSAVRHPENTKATTTPVDKSKSKKSISKAQKHVSSRPAIAQKSFLSQRSQLLQRSQLQQRSPVHHRSPTMPQRSPLAPKSSVTSKSSTARNVFPGKRQLSEKQQVSNVVTEEVCNNTEQSKQSTFLGVKFKRMKKANLADQIKRSKEGKLDLMTPDSILTSVHIKDLLNETTFGLLPPAYQYQLLILLPECDREIGSDSALRLSPHALNNEFFTRSCQEFKDKLMDGEFNSDIIQRAKHEVEINNRIDPWKVKYFQPVWGSSTLPETSDTPEEPPHNLKVVESSWASFLKFAENSTDDFEEALAKMQSAVKAAHQKQMEKEKEELQKREDNMQRCKQTLKTIVPNRCTSFRNTSTLKSRNVLRIETAAKEKSRKALKKAQLLQRKKALDKQLKDAKAKILEEARSSSRKDDDSIKSKLLNNSLDCSQLPSNMEGAINHLNHISTMNSNIFTNSSECTKTENENSKVINLCDSNALKNLIKNSDSMKNLIKSSDPTNLVLNFVPQTKHGPVRKRSGSRIVKGPSTFLTNSEGLCPCDLKSMVMCIQCETFWHGDSINGEQLCISCT